MCDTVTVDTSVQAHSVYNIKSEPSCKLWTLGDCVLMYVHKSNKSNSLVGDADRERDCARMGTGGILETLVFLS